MLEIQYNPDNKFELCIDEVGRGCLFGRTYIACVILPTNSNKIDAKINSFDGKNIKDSKKFSSKKKIKEVSEYIKRNALLWHIEYIESSIIDDINILQSVMRGMHECIRKTIIKLKDSGLLYQNNGNPNIGNEMMAIIDGN